MEQHIWYSVLMESLKYEPLAQALESAKKALEVFKNTFPSFKPINNFPECNN